MNCALLAPHRGVRECENAKVRRLLGTLSSSSAAKAGAWERGTSVPQSEA